MAPQLGAQGVGPDSAWAAPAFESLLQRRAAAGPSNSTVQALTAQWTNPNNVLAVLLVIGADVVQKALAQSTGTWFTPVCFSFGWVGYSFMAFVNIFSEGRLLPSPDYPAKVFNLQSGYFRQNQNWIIGRILRDHEQQIAHKNPLNGAGIRIAVYDAMENPSKNQQYPRTAAVFWGVFLMLLQFGIAIIPIAQTRDWGLLVITYAGTVLVSVTGALPQWAAEKLPNRQNADKVFALTTGKGSTDIMVIIGGGKCLDLEDLSAAPSPRSGRPWEKFPSYSVPQLDTNGSQMYDKRNLPLRAAKTVWGFPVGFWISRVVCSVTCVLWLALLVTVGGLESNSGLLLAIGAIGMVQNGIWAGMGRDPAKRRLPLQLKKTIMTKKVMDGIMDFEVSYPELGQPLLNEFFPGKKTREETLWWEGDRKPYDKMRFEDCFDRGIPQTMLTDKEKRTLTIPLATPLNTKTIRESEAKDAHQGHRRDGSTAPPTPSPSRGDEGDHRDSIDADGLLEDAQRRLGIEDVDTETRTISEGEGGHIE